MPEVATHRRELKNTGYEIFIGILSILSIVNIGMIRMHLMPYSRTAIRTCLAAS